MPIYEYRCPSCGTNFEELVPTASAADQVACPNCGQRGVVRQPSVFAAHSATKRGSSRLPPCGQRCGSDGSCPLVD